MNLNESNPVIVTESDYNLLKPFFSKISKPDEAMSLSSELSRAVVIKDDAFPKNAIRLNSKIKIVEETTGEAMEIIIVLPQYADIKQKKISILTPIAAALIGFREGEVVKWKVPAGLKQFKITEVIAP
ncbi:transcription elongation factor GreAB [Pedobacter changchengzhani]|uniref:Transcription elongation factor GreAB n=1 Tax=Pedobacter changchengzhani TaxID=2529274 RepID=A0A4R5MLF8_9SPHI|nr:GreA/GreB family elongation factor [Pedobacter changchengzhani]TDG36065.1 transcription elongation factor GreAB [Pedobacter changchengzhani]